MRSCSSQLFVLEHYLRLASLHAERINVCGICLHSPLKICVSNADVSAITMPLQGAVEFKVGSRYFLCAPGIPFFLISIRFLRPLFR